MKILGFVGISGSGKSYRALEVAASRGMKYIIDDGLLISEHRVIAGKSAKKENTRLASVRCALFFDKTLADEVKNAIKKENPDGLMILGTSHEMVEKIAAALSLPEISEYIEITDVATGEEIEKAKEIRRSQGKHVIPVPTFEIKKDFSGYWMDALKRMKKTKAQTEQNDRTVIRPTFSYLGEFAISKSVLTQICTYAAEQVENVTRCLSCAVTSYDDSGVDIRIDIAVLYGIPVRPVAQRVITAARDAVDKSTAINVNFITVNVKALTVRKEMK